MRWLRMIPSEEARQTRRGVRRYFYVQGEPIELSGSSDNDTEGLDDEDEQEEEYMEEDVEGLDMVEDEEYQNHE
jgi:hypothetical protein